MRALQKHGREQTGHENLHRQQYNMWLLIWADIRSSSSWRGICGCRQVDADRGVTACAAPG